MTANLPAIIKKAKEMQRDKADCIAAMAPKAMRTPMKREIQEARGLLQQACAAKKARCFGGLFSFHGVLTSIRRGVGNKKREIGRPNFPQFSRETRMNAMILVPET